LEVQEKKELRTKDEKTVPARYFVPTTDIHETDESLTVVMEVPGVDKEDIAVKLENDVLSVQGQIDFSKYQEMEPVYTEYNVGHYARSFTLSGQD
jgi:HSP20 family protein